MRKTWYSDQGNWEEKLALVLSSLDTTNLPPTKTLYLTNVIFQSPNTTQIVVADQDLATYKMNQILVINFQARACGGLGIAHASLGAHAEAARWHEASLRHATAAGNLLFHFIIYLCYISKPRRCPTVFILSYI